MPSSPTLPAAERSRLPQPSGEVLHESANSARAGGGRPRRPRDRRPTRGQGRLQLPGPSASGRSLLHLPRSRREETQGQTAPRRSGQSPAASWCRASRSRASSSAHHRRRADKRMPPRKSNLTLTKDEIDLLRRWIAEGAEYKPHWAFLPLPDGVPVPAVADAKWPAGPLDRFVLARLEREGLAAVAGRIERELDSPRHLRPDRPAADARRSGRLPRRPLAAGLRAGRGPPARLAALRRADGDGLARRGPLRGFVRLPGRRRQSASGRGATGSSPPSTKTSPSTASLPGRSPATCCPTPRASSGWRPPSAGCTA